jgi:aminopeptidase 2
VEETKEGIKVRQNRFLSTGDVKPDEDETLWWIPLELLTVENGKASIDHKAFLEQRESVIPVKDVANATFKLNAQTAGVCECFKVFFSRFLAGF